MGVVVPFQLKGRALCFGTGGLSVVLPGAPSTLEQLLLRLRPGGRQAGDWLTPARSGPQAEKGRTICGRSRAGNRRSSRLR